MFTPSVRRPATVVAACTVAVLGGAACCVSSTHAAIVYQDNFNRTGALGGTAPSPTNTGGATWGTMTLNGSSFNTTTTTNPNVGELLEAGPSGYAPGTAFLPYTMPGTGATTVSAAMQVGPSTNTGNGYGWEALGFMTANNQFEFTSATSDSPWWYVNSDGEVVAYANGSATSVYSGTIASFSNTSFYSFSVSYNAATQTASWYEGATLEATYTYGGTNDAPPAITQVGTGVFGSFTTGGVTAGLEDFTVQTGAVPEPATLGVLAAGGLGLLLRRRRPV